MTVAERMRKYRRLRNECKMIAPVEVDADTIQALIDAGLVRARDEENRVEVGLALARLIKIITSENIENFSLRVTP